LSADPLRHRGRIPGRGGAQGRTGEKPTHAARRRETWGRGAHKHTRLCPPRVGRFSHLGVGWPLASGKVRGANPLRRCVGVRSGGAKREGRVRNPRHRQHSTAARWEDESIVRRCRQPGKWTPQVRRNARGAGGAITPAHIAWYLDGSHTVYGVMIECAGDSGGRSARIHQRRTSRTTNRLPPHQQRSRFATRKRLVLMMRRDSHTRTPPVPHGGRAKEWERGRHAPAREMEAG
jgi:hypothetical protein